MSNETLNRRIFETPVDEVLYREIYRRLPSAAPTEYLDGAQGGASLMLALLNAVITSYPTLSGEGLMAEAVKIAVHISRANEDRKQEAFPVYING